MGRSLLWATSLAFALAACGGDDSPADEGSGGAGGATATSDVSTSTGAGGEGGSGGAGGEGDGGSITTPCPDDTTCVSEFPFHDARDTSIEGQNTISVYACKDTADESGPEIVYRVTAPHDGFVSVKVADDPGVDIDVHILTALDGDACLDRGDVSAKSDVPKGDLWIVADTYVSGGIPLVGAFAIDIGYVRSSKGACTMLSSAMPRVGDGGDTLLLPATGPVAKLGHLVTQDEGAPYPSTSSEHIDEHFGITAQTTGLVMPWTGAWAPLDGAAYYGAGAYAPTEMPALDEAFYVAMYWTAEARPPKGTRMILRDPASGRAVVVAAGYETGPADLNSIGGTTEEAHYYLGTDAGAELELGIAEDQGLPLGPRICD